MAYFVDLFGESRDETDCDPTRGRSAGTEANPLHDATRGRSAGTEANPLRDVTRGRRPAPTPGAPTTPPLPDAADD